MALFASLEPGVYYNIVIVPRIQLHSQLHCATLKILVVVYQGVVTSSHS